MTADEQSAESVVPEHTPASVDPPEASPAPSDTEPLVSTLRRACPAASHQLRLPVARGILAVSSVRRVAPPGTHHLRKISRAHPLSQEQRVWPVVGGVKAGACLPRRVHARLRSTFFWPVRRCAACGSFSRVPPAPTRLAADRGHVRVAEPSGGQQPIGRGCKTCRLKVPFWSVASARKAPNVCLGVGPMLAILQ